MPLSPLEIDVLMHAHCRCCPHPKMHIPIWADTHDMFVQQGVIVPEPCTEATFDVGEGG